MPLFAAGVLKAMTGHDVAKGLRGYKSLKEGLRKIKDKGFSDPSGPFAAVLEEIPPLMAQPGDIVKFEGELGVCLGVKIPGAAYAVDQVYGVGRADMTDAVAAYRVPF